MVVDSSALVCMIRREPEAAEILRAIDRDQVRLTSVASLLETGIVLERQLGRHGSRELEGILNRLQIYVAPVSVEQGKIALLAFWRFGKGIHPAGLNFGDCFSYALARTTGEPLLFKGDDFSRTDIPAVPY